ncbi:hypothetical protein IV203_015291 [Nitzschia inconspicua]|uniref:Uncharacterized protein n=1 Tax=Nitzschia inconspicua TaxID=303405 RepID=A0A9K3LAQ6_9STRA|nr:hypothetical protein IV203_015291 [Nitzschia inconspicua]
MALHLLAYSFLLYSNIDAISVDSGTLTSRLGLWRGQLSASSVSDKMASSDVDPATTTLEVCLSPGCLADGAQLTLQKLQALSDGSNIKVKKGVCCSLCGNGPVVLIGNIKIRKVSSDDKILKLLGSDDQSPDQRFQTILQSFELIQQARQAVKSRDFGAGVELFQKGMDLGMDQFSSSSSLAQVSYLVEALQEQACALPQLPDKESKTRAVDAAQRSVDLVKRTSESITDDDVVFLSYYSSLESLQEALESCNKGVPKVDEEIFRQELVTLQKLMGLPEPLGLTSTQKNKRRSLGFRLQKLERDVSLV